jgi:hypothetical protein
MLFPGPKEVPLSWYFMMSEVDLGYDQDSAVKELSELSFQ